MSAMLSLQQPLRLHPLTDRDYWNAWRTDPRHTVLLKQADESCAKAAELPLPGTATSFLAAKRFNDRGQRDHAWQGERATLAALAFHRCLAGLDPNDPDDRLLNWTWGMLTEPTWTVSAHLPDNDLPLLGRPHLDLASCEMAAFFAEMREVLKPWMDSVSGTLSDSVVRAIDALVLTPYAEGVDVWWQDKPHSHFNNWTGVCAGSILAACESLASQGHPRPKARERALAGLRLFWEKAFTASGECDEGLGYWGYGVGFACLGMSRLSRDDLKASFDLERVRAVADYPRRAHLFRECFFTGNDGGLRCHASLDFVPWLAAVTGSEFLARWASEYPGLGRLRHFGQYIRMLEMPELPKAAAESRRPAVQHLPDQQVAIFRQPTPTGELLVTLTGGDNAERHNHNDLGHFMVAVDGQFVIPDIGAPHYTTDFFGPKRYTYVPASSRGHCCPLIGDAEQRAGAEAAGKILAWEPDAATPRLSLDLTAAYPPEAGLLSWTRTMERREAKDERCAQIVITDRFKTSAPNQKITHVIWSLEPFREPNERVEGTGVQLQLGALSVEISPAPTALGSSAFAPKDLNLRDFQGQTLHRIEATFRTDAKGELTVETRMGVNYGR
jgi:hypothetical protein